MANFTNPIIPGDPQGLNRMNENFAYLNNKTSALQAPPFVVSSQTAMLALSEAVIGNIAIRTDITAESNQFMLTALPASTLGNWMQLPMSVSAVMSVNGQTGNVLLDANHILDPTSGQSLSASAAEANVAILQADRLYNGMDLTIKFQAQIAASPFNGDVWAWLRARIQAANFDGIHVNDFIPLAFAGNTFHMEIAGINTYRGYGDVEIGNHIDLISREVWPATIQWNLVNYNNGLLTMPNPWLVSNVYAFLNSLNIQVPNGTGADPATVTANFTATGIYHQLPAALRNVIVQKRKLLLRRHTTGQLLINSNSQDWRDMGFLWIPDEFEVYGSGVWGDTMQPHQGRDKFGAVQYPIFAENMKRLKRIAGTNTRSHWWLSTPCGGSSATVANVNGDGFASHNAAAYTSLRVPLCFRIA